MYLLYVVFLHLAFLLSFFSSLSLSLSLVVECADERRAALDPVLLGLLGRDLDREHVVGGVPRGVPCVGSPNTNTQRAHHRDTRNRHHKRM